MPQVCAFDKSLSATTNHLVAGHEKVRGFMSLLEQNVMNTRKNTQFCLHIFESTTFHVLMYA